MTQARTRANGLVTPSLPQLWLTAMLRAFVELVLNVVSSLRMGPSRLPAECHSDVPPQALPEENNDIQQQETNAAVPQDSSIALMVSSMAKAMRPSNHEGVLANLAGWLTTGIARSLFRSSRRKPGPRAASGLVQRS